MWRGRSVPRRRRAIDCRNGLRDRINPEGREIVGPGGLYASVAKRLVSRDVPVDFFAGPTELVIVADDSTDALAAAWDLVGQAEHGEETLCGLITWDTEHREEGPVGGRPDREDGGEGRVRPQGAREGIRCGLPDKEEALRLVNAIAPEHLELLVNDARVLRGEGRERRSHLGRQVRSVRRERLLHRHRPRHPDRRICAGEDGIVRAGLRQAELGR